MKRILRFAGIGPRDTPAEWLVVMTQIGHQLASMGWTGVSGFSPGADTAWMMGVPHAQQQIYLPWAGYENADHRDKRFINTGVHADIVDVAAKHYLAGDWNKLSTGKQLLFIRNVAILAGNELDVGVDMCCYWQSEKNIGSKYGGTNHAVRVAQDAGIPTFNIGLKEDQHAMELYVERLESCNK